MSDRDREAWRALIRRNAERDLLETWVRIVTAGALVYFVAHILAFLVAELM